MRHLKRYDNYTVNEGLVDWVKSLFHTDEDEKVGEGIFRSMKGKSDKGKCYDFNCDGGVITFKFRYFRLPHHARMIPISNEESPEFFVKVITQQGTASPKNPTKVSIGKINTSDEIELNLSSYLVDKIASTAKSLCKGGSSDMYKKSIVSEPSSKVELRSSLRGRFKTESPVKGLGKSVRNGIGSFLGGGYGEDGGSFR